MTAVGVDRAKLYKVTFDQRSMFSPTTVYYYWSILIFNLDFISLLFSHLPIFISNQQVDPGMTKNTCFHLVVVYILCVTAYH